MNNRIPQLQVKRCILWGGTGQSKVVRPILKKQGIEITAIFDNAIELKSPFSDIPLLGGQAEFERIDYNSDGMGFVVCIGGTHGDVRTRISHWLQSKGLIPISAIHHTALIVESASIGVGVQIMAGSIVSEDAHIGKYSILNTGSSVDHECMLGEGVHLMPRATLAGLVEIGDHASIGTNATVLPRIKIGRGAIVGAGAVVTKDVPDGIRVIGCPARPLR